MRTRAPVHQNALRNLPALNETRWHQNRFFPPGRHIRKLGVQGSKLGVQGSKLGVQGSKSDPGTSVSPDPALMSRLVCKYHHRQIANRPTHHHIRSADFSYVARLSITTFRVRFPTALLRKIVAATRLLHYFPPLGTLVMAKMSGSKIAPSHTIRIDATIRKHLTNTGRSAGVLSKSFAQSHGFGIRAVPLP